MAKKSEQAEEAVVRTRAPEQYPWHDDLWQMTRGAMMRLPHALLLHGLPGLGKQAFGLRLARSLLCLTPNGAGDACGSCKSCALLDAGTHPDIAMVTTLADSKVISVDQIRELTDFMSLKPHTATRKVAVLWPAHVMNVNAANSLLKMLEEPPAGSFLLLVSDQAGRIPATVRSRCARVIFRPPARDEAMRWLEDTRGTQSDNVSLLALAGGAPLAAAVFAETGWIEQRDSLLTDLENLAGHRDTPCACASRWKSAGAEPAVDAVYGLAADLVRLGTAGPGASVSAPELRDRLQHILQSIELKKLYHFLDAVSEVRNLLRTPLDQLLLIEDLLIRWQRVVPRIV
jgi:DNA polymerase-3 subunit delta'